MSVPMNTFPMVDLHLSSGVSSGGRYFYSMGNPPHKVPSPGGNIYPHMRNPCHVTFPSQEASSVLMPLQPFIDQYGGGYYPAGQGQGVNQDSSWPAIPQNQFFHAPWTQMLQFITVASLVTASHTGTPSPISASHVGDWSTTFTSHVEDLQLAVASYDGGTSPVTAYHTSIISPTFASHVGDWSTTSVSHVEDLQAATTSHARGTSLVTAYHTSIISPTSASHVGDWLTTSASHVEDPQLATASHVGGTCLVTASQTAHPSPTSASHVGDFLLASASHARSMSPATASHAGGIHMIEKPRHLGHKPRCRTCEGIHLTCLCPITTWIPEAWGSPKGPLGSKASMVLHHSAPSLVDTIVMFMQSSVDTPFHLGVDVSFDLVVSNPVQPMVVSMQSSTDTSPMIGGDASLDLIVSHLVQPMVVSMQSPTDATPIFGGDAPLDFVVSHPIQPMVEEMVISMKYLIDPTLLFESDKSK
jgi:hypothetical protein